MAYHYNNELYHHGVKGMKWGVRHERKKSPRKKSSEDENDLKKSKGLSDKQKQTIKIGASAAAAGLSNYGGYRLHKSGKLNKSILRGKEVLHGSIPSSLKKLIKPESVSESLQKVNPLRGKEESKNNCAVCGVFAHLRIFEGLDVQAGSTGGERQNQNGLVESIFKFKDEQDHKKRIKDGSAITFGKSRDEAAAMLVRKFGDNADGLCGIEWKDIDDGHTFSWSIKNGKVKFFDAQSGYTDEAVSKYWKLIDPNKSLQLARLDGLEFNEDEVKKWMYK